MLTIKRIDPFITNKMISDETEYCIYNIATINKQSESSDDSSSGLDKPQD
jgi:hypothetical protein